VVRKGGLASLNGVHPVVLGLPEDAPALEIAMCGTDFNEMIGDNAVNLVNDEERTCDFVGRTAGQFDDAVAPEVLRRYHRGGCNSGAAGFVTTTDRTSFLADPRTDNCHTKRMGRSRNGMIAQGGCGLRASRWLAMAIPACGLVASRWRKSTSCTGRCAFGSGSCREGGA
jgi:hypothetical protein